MIVFGCFVLVLFTFVCFGLCCSLGFSWVVCSWSLVFCVCGLFV